MPEAAPSRGLMKDKWQKLCVLSGLRVVVVCVRNAQGKYLAADREGEEGKGTLIAIYPRVPAPRAKGRGRGRGAGIGAAASSSTSLSGQKGSLLRPVHSPPHSGEMDLERNHRPRPRPRLRPRPRSSSISCLGKKRGRWPFSEEEDDVDDIHAGPADPSRVDGRQMGIKSSTSLMAFQWWQAKKKGAIVLICPPSSSG